MAKLVSFPGTGTGLKVLGREVPTGPKAVFGLFVLAFFVALPGAWFVEFGLKIPPCNLCIPQRHAFWGALGCGAAGFVLTAPSMPWRKTMSYLTWGLVGFGFVSLAYGLSVAGYHTGVEQGWWPGPPGCTSGGSAVPGSVEAMQDLLRGGTRLASCEEIPISIFGLSLAALNVIWTSMVMAAGVLLLVRGQAVPRSPKEPIAKEAAL